MTKKKITVFSALVLLAAILCGIVFIPRSSLKEIGSDDINSLFQKISYKSTESGYDAYLENNAQLAPIGQAINLEAGLTVSAGESWQSTFELPQAGLFLLRFTYRIPKSQYGTPEINILINGAQPFSEAAGIDLAHRYISAEPETDERGNQYSVKLTEDTGLDTAFAMDSTGYHTQPLVFAANQGVNNIALELENGGAELVQVELLPSDYTNNYDASPIGTSNGGGQKLRIEAEMPLYRSDTSITEICDRTTPATSPSFDGLQIWNALGGNGWGKIGQTVTWNAEVEQSGWYTLSFRYRQNYSSGRSSCRRFLIDGKAPEKELEYLKFAYGGDWQMYSPTDDNGKAARLWLEKGSHTITLEVTLGNDADIVNLAQQSLYELNTVYRRIVMQTGADPDKYRDYQIEKKMPEVLQTLESEVEILNGIYSALYGSSAGEDSASITKLIWQINEFLKQPESIPANLSSFQSNITSYGAWLQGKTAQPLCLDYIELLPENTSSGKANASFLSQFAFGTVQFLRSFSDEYGVVGSVYSKESEPLTVWLTNGRDQHQILKEHIDNYFTADSGISVNLKLVSGGLLESIAAGIAPDVYLFGSQTDPVNFASRGALLDLSGFDDFKTISADFSEQAVKPFTYNGGTYALPVTESFLMMFARKDILSEVGLSVPRTWQDIYDMLTVLQQNNMEFGFPVPSNADISGYALILFQKQQNLYRDDGKTVALDTAAALDSFEEWTKLYTDYSSLVSYNFVNRFRMGDMPIGIVDFSTYNTLQVSAPEINGLWDMYPVPGTQAGETGKSVNTLTSAFILAQSDQPENSWKFLKWFVGETEQLRYARAIEDIQGVSARFATANKKAFAQLPWKNATLSSLETQRANAIGVEQVPGGYFLARHIDNIYRAVKNDGADVRQTALEYTDIINAELTRKRHEFGLEVAK